MKTLKQLREEYGDSPWEIPEELLLEAKDKSLMGPTIPSPKEMPVMLLFRRVTYRVYPNKQVVALYYSKMIDKYFSVPFGPTGNLNVNEATMIDEDWQKVNRKDKTDGLSQAAVNAYRRENPGSKLKTAVTEKNPTGKRASRRKSFCSRMGGMKKRLTSAKTARDPDSRINKALRRWNCEESFKMKLAEKRMQHNEGIVGDTIEKGRQWAQNKVKGSKTFKAIQDFGHQLPGYENVKSAKEKFSKGDYSGAALETGKSLGKAALTGAAVAGAGYLGVRALPTLGRAALRAGSMLAKSATSSKETDTQEPEHIIQTSGPKTPGAKIKPTMKSKLTTKVSENKISDIRAMVESNSLHELNINGRIVTLNNSMAKRILEVYDSVNTKNKKIVEGMLNEDLESFKKLLNFSIRN